MERVRDRILILDLIPDATGVLEEYLDTKGCAVTVILDVDQALQRIARESFDFVLVLERVSGGVLERFLRRATHLNPNLHIVLSTADLDQLRLLKSQYDRLRWLTPPLVLEDLWSVIRSLSVNLDAG